MSENSNTSIPEQHTPPVSSEPVTPPQVEKTNTLAIVSLVSSLFIGLVGVITGHIARKQIKERGERGDGLAIAGLIIGYLQIAATVFGIIFALIVGAFVAGEVTNSVKEISSSVESNSGGGSVSEGESLTEVEANACEELLNIGTDYVEGTLTELEAQQALADLYVKTQDTEFGMLLDETTQTGDATGLFEYCGTEAKLF